jgi:hypothetical protein
MSQISFKQKSITLLIGIVLGFGIANFWHHVSTPPIPPAPNAESNTQDVTQRQELQCPTLQCPPCESEITFAPPELRSDVPNPLVSQLGQEARVAWLPVPGVKSYRVFVKNSKGTVVTSYTTKKTNAVLKDVPRPRSSKPSQYWVSVQSLNNLGLPGEASEKRRLLVYGRNDLIAPEIKTILIED